jgi:hypothetical protein
LTACVLVVTERIVAIVTGPTLIAKMILPT